MSALAINFMGAQIPFAPWTPTSGNIGAAFAYDTETTALNDPTVIQDYVIGTVFDGQTGYFVRRQDLQAFWDLHQMSQVFMHTAAFDLEVTTKACGFDFAGMVEAGRVVDISILYRLLWTAKTGNLPFRYSLDHMADELLGVTLAKDDAIRLSFGQFLRDGVVDYPSIPEEYLRYAALDAIVTHRLGCGLEQQCRAVQAQSPPAENGANGTFGLLSHDVQLRGDIALRAIEHLGVGVDPAAVETLDNELQATMLDSQAVLSRYDYIAGKPGTKAAFNQVVAGIAKEREIPLLVTEKTGDACQGEDALLPMADHEFVAAFLRFKQAEKLRSTYVRHLREAGTRVFPHYTLLVRTGRTSCSRPNIQNLPREGKVRSCLVPSPGHVLITCDYSMLELCALAQICYSRYGQSHMRELINQGVDLHRHVASMILGKPMAEVTREERQRAKAVSFGLPGGMGVNGLRGYASASYGVWLTEAEASKWQARWLDLFPEMQLYLARGNALGELGRHLDVDSYPGGRISPVTAAALVMRVAGGHPDTSTGRRFSSVEMDWAWMLIEETPAAEYKLTRDLVAARQGDRLVQWAITPGTTVVLPTGRVKANCRFTQEHNAPFQGLSADGAKLALYDLMRAGFQVVAFIHDEVLVEVPVMNDYRQPAEEISRIMVDAMRKVCPDVEIRTEFAVMHRWDKAAKARYDEQGQLVPFS